MMLEISNLGVVRGNHAIIRGLDLFIGEREIHAIIGPNGSGKSTLAYTIMGCGGYTASSGTVRFNGADITRATMYERAQLGITLAWQEPARFEGLTVSDYLSIGTSDPDRIKEALGMVNLDAAEYLGREVGEGLSGGERKRIELAAVVTMQPALKLAILDEPDSGIDVVTLSDIIELIKTIRDRGSSVLLITHRPEIAEHCDSASLICGGTIIKTGKPHEVNSFFEHEYEPYGRFR